MDMMCTKKVATLNADRVRWPKRTIQMIAVISAVSLGARAAEAQVPYLIIDGQPGDWFGTRMEPTGDLNLDGVMDLVFGFNGAGCGGKVSVLSGVDGSTILPPVCGDFNDLLGWSVDGGGDFNGDGVSDYVAGDIETAATFDGEVVVISGKDASILVTIDDGVDGNEFGERVAFIGDINGDGFDDIAAAGFDHPVRIYLGPTGALHRVHNGVFTRPDVDAVGDVNGDGAPDYVIGWPQVSKGGKLFVGQAAVFSGKTGVVIHREFGINAWDHLGRSVAGVGDVNGDGVPDFAAGAPGEITMSFGFTQGYVRIFSGADGSLLLHVDGTGPEPFDLGNFGDQIDGGGDVNGDGVGDLVVGAPNDHSKSGSMSVVSGRTGTILWKIRGETQNFNTGNSQIIVDDLDADGLVEFAVGDPTDTTGGPGSGRVTIYSGALGDAERICTSSANSAGPGAVIGLDGAISIGNAELALTVTGGVPGKAGLFFYGAGVQQKPFGNGVLCVAAGGVGIFRLGLVTMDTGGAARLPVDFTSPPVSQGKGAWTAGSSWTVQFWYRDPAAGGPAFNTSDAMRVTFTP